MAIFIVQVSTILLESDIFYCEILGFTMPLGAIIFYWPHNISEMLHSADPDVILAIYRK